MLVRQSRLLEQWHCFKWEETRHSLITSHATSASSVSCLPGSVMEEGVLTSFWPSGRPLPAWVYRRHLFDAHYRRIVLHHPETPAASYYSSSPTTTGPRVIARRSPPSFNQMLSLPARHRGWCPRVQELERARNIRRVETVAMRKRVKKGVDGRERRCCCISRWCGCR